MSLFEGLWNWWTSPDTQRQLANLVQGTAQVAVGVVQVDEALEQMENERVEAQGAEDSFDRPQAARRPVRLDEGVVQIIGGMEQVAEAFKQLRRPASLADRLGQIESQHLRGKRTDDQKAHAGTK